MTTTRTGLCIGGPHDGKRFESRNPNGFAVPLMETVPIEASWPKKVTQIKNVNYRPEVFHTPETDFYIWVPYDQTIAETMFKLLHDYEMKRKSNDDL